MTPRKSQRLHRFYLIRPRANANIDELAERLIGLKHVEEVYVTDGKYGYLVKTRFEEGRNLKQAVAYIQKHVDRKFGEVVSHFEYRKGPGTA